jgi:diacylglycerol kinase
MIEDHGLITSFKHAFKGICYVVLSQRNARIHLLFTVGVVLVGGYVGLSTLEWAVLALTIGLVLATEWFNTVIESVVDLVTAEYHPLAKTAKDVAAGGVLLTAVVAVVVGGLLLGLPLLHKIVDLL